MSLVVNHNLMAANVARNLNSHYANLSNSTQRLSTGLRINSAADDAAGLAIRELQRADIAAFHQGARNANDAISLIQVADGALQVIDEKLIRMKELAEQAATGTYDSVQRLMIESEYQAMASEITRIALATDFNGIQLLDGTLYGEHNGSEYTAKGQLKVHFGTGNDSSEDYYYIEIRESTAAAFGVGNDSTWEDAITRLKTDFKEDVLTRLQNCDASVDVTAYADTWADDLESTLRKLSMPENVDDFYNILDNYNNYFNPIEEEGNYKLPDMPTTYPEYLSLDYREKQKWQYTWGHSAMATFKNYAQQQLDININPITGTIKDVENNVTGIDKSIRQSTNDLIRYEMTIDSTASDPHAVPTSDLFTNPKDGSPAITDGSDDWYLTITALDQALVDVYEDTQKYTYAGYSIATQEDAQISLEAINEAIVIKDKIRADLGALQNRFENTITNLNTMAENLQAAESRISDADVSTEMTEFVRQQILTQAAVAMLAQANSLPQMAMQLIGG